MRASTKTLIRCAAFVVALLLTTLVPPLVQAQWPFGTPTTPDAQRNALNAVRSQINWLQNATRTAAGYGEAGYGNLWSQFEALRGTYSGFTQTLNSQQLAQGANDLAELGAGLDIIQEAFTNYQEAVAAGQSPMAALRDACQILREASQVWLREFNNRCARLRVGWG